MHTDTQSSNENNKKIILFAPEGLVNYFFIVRDCKNTHGHDDSKTM